MPENQKDPGNEKLLILPLGEESRKITQVISNDTARHIIELLADAPLSASDIAQRLQAPLTTIAYNLENLESVGLVKVERIKYSEKGREVKIYAPVRKLIVVVPEKTDRRSVADLLRKYLGVILAAVLASSLIEWFTKGADLMQNYDYSLKETPVPSPGVSQLPSITSTPLQMVNETIKGGEATGIVPAPAGVLNATATSVTVQPAALDNGAASQAVPDIFTNLARTIAVHPGLLFFMGCLFVVALFIVMDYRKKRKNG